MLERMVYELRSYVMAHRLATTDVTEHFSRDVEMESGEPKHLVIPQALTVLLMTAVGLIAANILLVLAAALVALVSVVAYAYNQPETLKTTVHGKVTVPITNYNTFPCNEVVYPKSLGNAVRVQQLGTPYYEWTNN